MPFRYTRYPATPTLSVAASQATPSDVVEVEVQRMPCGTDGAVVSGPAVGDGVTVGDGVAVGVGVGSGGIGSGGSGTLGVLGELGELGAPPVMVDDDDDGAGSEIGIAAPVGTASASAQPAGSTLT